MMMRCCERFGQPWWVALGVEPDDPAGLQIAWAYEGVRQREEMRRMELMVRSGVRL